MNCRERFPAQTRGRCGAQLAWCRAEGVKRAIFTHCGSEVVRSNARALGTRIRKLGLEQGVEACLAP
jgi:hypothetical protein